MANQMKTVTYGHTSAFPEPTGGDPQYSERTYGLTKREYFAATVLAGLVNKGGTFEEAAHKAVMLADELIMKLNEIKP